MCRTLRPAVIGLVAAAALLLAGSASADCAISSEYRSMHGKIASVVGGALTLAQRGGDKVAFERAGGVKVMGAKTSWSKLAAGDSAIVGWKIADSPAVAYEICVLPSR